MHLKDLIGKLFGDRGYISQEFLVLLIKIETHVGQGVQNLGAVALNTEVLDNELKLLLFVSPQYSQNALAEPYCTITPQTLA
ncbi:MAG: hypothetical protein DSM106950_37070 [Stigonema ocellatum SAG 48.90 = DSM 106950]|nr:hypothetical protein [Stigonema ocellatum SAG 48.90 = DSM 106950]